MSYVINAPTGKIIRISFHELRSGFVYGTRSGRYNFVISNLKIRDQLRNDRQITMLAYDNRVFSSFFGITEMLFCQMVIYTGPEPLYSFLNER